MLKRVLLVSTSAHDLNGHPTGLWLEELAAPYHLFKKAKFDVDIVSIKGGRVPIDRVSIPNGIPREFKHVASLLQNTRAISTVHSSEYDAVLFCGGHGAIVDFPGNPYVANLIENMYNNNRIVAAVCHGVSSLVGVKNKDGSFFVAGKRITGYTNDEEKAVHLENRVPFLLESKLKEEGALFYVAPNFTPHVVVGYSLVVGIGSMIYGKLADRYSVKKLLIISIIIFVAGSIIGFMNQSYAITILARLVQASGGAAFIALSMIAVAKLVAPAKKPGALAMISSSIALAIGIGPLVGGAITNTLGWPYLFLFMVISVVGIFLLIKFMPEEAQHTDEAFHFDYIGAALLFAFITTVLLGVNINSWLFVLSVAFLFLFTVRMKNAEHPFIDIELFSNKPFLRLIAVGFIINVALCASLLLLPSLLGRVHGLSPFVIGIALFVASLFGIVSSFITGKIVPSFGNVNIIYVASVIMIVGFLILGLIPNGNLIIILVAVILTFMSYSAIQVSLNTFIPKTLHPAKVGVGLGLYNLINFFGMAFGPAVASKVMEATNSYRLNFILIIILISAHFFLLIGMSSFQKKMEQ